MRYLIRSPLALAAALACTGFAPTAVADISFEGGGSFEVAPMYRAFTFAGLDRDNNGAYPADDVDGVDYVSNLVPKTLATANASVVADGAAFTGTAWSAWSGFYASRNHASMTVTNANEAHRYYAVGGQGSSTTVQFFTPEAAAARAVFTFSVSGLDDNPFLQGNATGRLDFYATTEAGRSWVDLFNGGFEGSLSERGTGTFSYSLPVTALGTPIYLHFWSSAFVEYLGGEVPGGSSFTATADYGNTVVLEDVQLFDADDNALAEWSMEDVEMGQTVFNQDGRLAEVLPPPPIPEPGTWALLLAGLVAVGHRVRGRLPARPA